jgi:hypothetical protein
VEGADQLFAVHRAAVTEVRAQVRAERVVQVGLAVVVTPEGEVLAEVLDRHDLADRDIARPADLEPSEGDRERRALRHGLAPSRVMAVHHEKLERVPV